MKPALTPEEILTVANAHLIDGVEQQIIARLIGINHGRVTEACIAMDYARNHVKEIYELARGNRILTAVLKQKETT